MSSGEYLNPPPLPPSTVAELSSSDSSFSLGASALSLMSNVNPAGSYSPNIYSLMDSFRDIAETNSWDKLEPSQVQGLMETFRAAERDRFGLDAESYVRVSSSFEQFFQQLNSRFMTRNEDNPAALTDIEYQPNILTGSDGRVTQPMAGRSPPDYAHQPDTMPMFPVSSASPPNSNYPPPQRTPSPHTSMSPQGPCSVHTHLLSAQTTAAHYNTFSAPFPGQSPPPFPGQNPSLGGMAPQRLPADMTVKSSATDLFDNDDDDDFDWSKLM